MKIGDITRIFATVVVIGLIWMDFKWALKLALTIALIGNELTYWLVAWAVKKAAVAL